MVPLVEELRKQDVIDQLIWDDSVNANDVTVNVRDKTVRLTGKVPNYVAKLAAERDARYVSGVKNVENFLEVEFPPKITIPEDNEISENIMRMLYMNSKFISPDIQVETNKGLVTLKGKVGTYWEKYLAEEIANSIHGVLGVENKLSVSLYRNIHDEDIKKDIKAAYKRSILLDESKLAVEVDSGIARLSGSVVNYAVKNEALEKAIYTAGVKDVIDEITIE